MGHTRAALVSNTDARLYFREHTQWDSHITLVSHQPYVIAVNPRHGRLLDAINAALNTLETDGTLAMLLYRWLY